MTTIDSGKRDGHAIWFRRVKYMVSRSRLGGLPSLPSEIDWPVNTRKKTPLHFLGQIDLSALPPLPFPDDPDGPVLPNGMLFFFQAHATENSSGRNSDEQDGSDPSNRTLDRVNSRVVYAPTAGPDRAAPVDLPLIWELEHQGHPAVTFPEAPLVAHLVDMDQPPEALLAAIKNVTGEDAPILDDAMFLHAVRSWPTELPSYRIARQSSGYDLAQVDRLTMFGGPYHMQAEAVLAKSEGRHLLMQFFDANFGELLSNDGVIQFWIMPKDLRECRFHRAWATLETG